VVLVDVLGGIILPLLPFYAESMGATPLTVGLLVSAFAVCQLLVGPPLGHLSDRVGRRPVLLISQFGTFVSFLILAAARSLWVVFLARIINGLTAGNLTVAQAAISDVTKPEERAKAFGLIGVAFSIGFMVGPA
jgi:MFS family permease